MFILRFIIHIVVIYAVIFIVVILYRRYEVHKVHKARDELNAHFEETGSPFRYYPNQEDWLWVESYDETPEDEVIKYMNEMHKRYDLYLASGGDPKTIKDEKDIFNLPSNEK